VVVAGVVAALVVVPMGATSNPAVTGTMRRAIDATLARFIVDAVERRDPAAAWALAGPGLRAGTTRADWAAGRLPVYPFQPSRRTFHGWTPSYSALGKVSFDLVLQPRHGAKTGAVAFNVTMRFVHGRWLVDYWVPVASFAPAGQRPQIAGPGDLAAPSERATTPASHGALGSIWLIVPVGVLSLAALVPIGFAVVSWRHRRRARPGGKRAGLPPLPGTQRRTP
jgi:hypothetical protein